VALVENVTKGGQPPAQWFSRPGLVAAPTMENSPDLGIWYDPEAAQAELALFMEDMGVASVDELDPIIMMTNDLEGNIIIAEAIQQMWINELGIQVNMATQDWKNYLAGLTVHSPHVYRLGWCNDYFDANNFIGDVFRSTSGNNHTFWDDDDAHALDELLDRAMVEPDPETRLDLYREAENYLVKEHAVIIPLYWYTNLDMFKPYINPVPVQAGTNRYELWSFGEE
jgi:oligopeptide transport system substrate-binding protein